jgi:hypothetical protein
MATGQKVTVTKEDDLIIHLPRPETKLQRDAVELVLSDKRNRWLAIDFALDHPSTGADQLSKSGKTTKQ